MADNISENRSVFEQLKRHKHEICSGIELLNECPMAFLKIKSCNADGPCSFSDAWCETERSTEFAQLVTLFDISLLTKFLDSGEIEGDFRKQKSLQWAFETLADFLDKDYNKMNEVLEKYRKSTLYEYQWVTLFGTHIVRKLSCSKVMTISDADYEKRLDECMCLCGEALQYGDTSMGNKRVWHGSVDILLGNVAVDIINTKKEQEEDPSGSAYELKRENLEKHAHQICSQSIVFSCTERSERQCSSAPLIAVSLEDFKMYMYDYDSDLFVESQEFPLKTPVPIVSVLALWLIINHNLFGKQLEYREFGFFAEFKKFLQYNNKVEVYDKDLKLRECKKVHTRKDPLKEDFMVRKMRGGFSWVKQDRKIKKRGDGGDCVEEEEVVAEKKRKIDHSD